MTPWMLLLGQAALSLAMLVVGADVMVRGASALGIRYGLSPLTVGLTIVAVGTSAPELFVSLDAATSGSSDIAVGNVVGSNICNLGLILGIAAMWHPPTVHAQVFRLEAPLLVAASIGLALLWSWDAMGRWAGAAMVITLIAFVWRTIRQPDELAGTVDDIATPKPRRAWWDASRVLAGLGALSFGAHLLVDASVQGATALGVSEATIGLTIVAVGTSLPELATSVVAAARGNGDIVVGNVVGSNLFNILGILGLTAVVQPLPRGGIEGVDMAVMLGLALLLLPIMRTGFTVSRCEGAGLLASYLAYVGWRTFV